MKNILERAVKGGSEITGLIRLKLLFTIEVVTRNLENLLWNPWVMLVKDAELKIRGYCRLITLMEKDTRNARNIKEMPQDFTRIFPRMVTATSCYVLIVIGSNVMKTKNLFNIIQNTSNLRYFKNGRRVIRNG